MTRQEHSSRPAGCVSLASVSRDRLYSLGSKGFVYASDAVITRATARPSAVVLLAVDGRSFGLGRPGDIRWHRAAAVRPFVERDLHAADVSLLSFNVPPVHPAYPVFQRIASTGIEPLDRARFRHLDAELGAAHRGEASPEALQALFDAVIAEAADTLGSCRRVDPRAERLLQRLAVQPEASLAQLADELEMSYTGASRLFSRAVGLSLRSFRSWQKSMQALTDLPTPRSLTEIAHRSGFSDAAHLSREWRRWYGISPVWFRRRVQVVDAARASRQRG